VEKRLLVVLPLARGIVRPGRAVRRILARLPQAQLLILDERRGALPETDELPRDQRITHVACRGRGLELAYADGLRYAQRHGFAGALTLEIDGRGGVDPRGLQPLAQALGSADLLLGVRGPQNPSSWIDPRSWQTHFIGLATKLLLGRRLADPATPFRLYGTAALKLLAEPPYEERSFQLVALARVLRGGLEVREIAVPAIRRGSVWSALQGASALLRLRRSPRPSA
jgi:hypothetical protein